MNACMGCKGLNAVMGCRIPGVCMECKGLNAVVGCRMPGACLCCVVECWYGLQENGELC